jgi:hypothetical protein
MPDDAEIFSITEFVNQSHGFFYEINGQLIPHTGAERSLS